MWRTVATIAFGLLVCAASATGASHPAEERLDVLRHALATADPSDVMVTAHRACWKEGSPENSVSAIVSCASLGVDIAEIDVHLTRDGVPILLHDPTLDRTTSGRGLVSNQTLSKVRKLFLRSGAGGSSSPLTDQKVPTLEEALLAARGRILINLDVKGEAFDAAFQVVRRLGVANQILMKMNAHADDPALLHASFLGKTMFMPIIRQCSPSAGAAACTQNLSEEIPTFAGFSPIAYEVVFTSEGFLQGLERHVVGKRIWVNALNPDLAAGITDEKALENPEANWGRLVALGATIIQTDEPRKLIDYLQAHGRRSRDAVYREGKPKHPTGAAQPTRAGAKGEVDFLPVWSKGYFYIHHISTGRGNATYFVFPDGTTMLVDAGEADPQFIESVQPLKPFPPRPDGVHSAAYWIADYIREFAPAGRPVKLQYALITHFHTDHFGTITADKPMSHTGVYRLAGITELADLIPIDTLIDRAAPSYDYPVDLRKCLQSPDGPQGSNRTSLSNYLDFAEYRMKHGQAVVGLQPGGLDQIKLGEADAFPSFHVRNISSNGIIWSGAEDETQYYIPKGAVTDCGFDENPFSNVLTFAFGKFNYYTGGDIPGIPNYTQPWWRDIETPVSAVVGPVDVMLLDHHGNRDSTNENILRNLQPRVIVQENWLSPQPGEEVVFRMASKGLYPGPRDVFSTGMSPESREVIGPIMDSIYKSYSGHVVIRVAPGGDHYEVYILNDANTRREVVKRFGTYQSK